MFLNQPLFHMHFVSDGSGEGQGWEFTTDVTNFFSHPEEYGEALTIHREPINNVGIPIFASSFLDTFYTSEYGQTWDYWGYYPEYPYSTYAFKTADDIQNGLTTLDLVRIKKHILQVDPMQNPYRLLAADVNDSESITTLDLVAIQKVILGIETEFPNQQIWKFVPICYEFPVPSDPWFEPIPYTYSVNEFAGRPYFYGIKLGDVNESVDPQL